MVARNAFEYTVDKILNKRCVPVAGAGISLSSQSADGDHIHNVVWMVETIKKELIRLRFERYDKCEHGSVCKCWCSHELDNQGYNGFDSDCQSSCYFCDVINAAGKNRLGDLSELYIWEFEKPEEGYKSLVELLGIESYKDLVPTDAHKYIARLARESLISEVITTNYDCNFEKAYNKLSKGKNSDVITSLDDYRKLGGEAGFINRLKVYKINGCAGKLVEKNNYDSILLTERQLQKWRNRQWAADLFKDRLRSKSLLFVGFGSDEPQIHHTVQSVLDEYADDIENNSTHVLDTHTAPIVAIFEANPSFHQQQIVKTYALHHKLHPSEGDELILRNPQIGKTLGADHLWQLIYERVARTLIVEALRLSLNPEYSSFTSIVPFSQTIIHDALSSVERVKDKDYDTETPDWIKVISRIAEEDCSDNCRYFTIANALTYLRYGIGEVYEPISSNKSLVSEFLVVLFLLENKINSVIKADSGNGLEVKYVNEGNGTSNKIFYLNADSSVVSNSDTIHSSVGSNQLTLMLGRAGKYIRPGIQRVNNINSASGTITPKTIVTLGWQHIFDARNYDGNKDTVTDTLIEAIQSPSNFYYRNQPSVNSYKRPYLKESD